MGNCQKKNTVNPNMSNVLQNEGQEDDDANIPATNGLINHNGITLEQDDENGNSNLLAPGGVNDQNEDAEQELYNTGSNYQGILPGNHNIMGQVVFLEEYYSPNTNSTNLNNSLLDSDIIIDQDNNINNIGSFNTDSSTTGNMTPSFSLSVDSLDIGTHPLGSLSSQSGINQSSSFSGIRVADSNMHPASRDATDRIASNGSHFCKDGRPIASHIKRSASDVSNIIASDPSNPTVSPRRAAAGQHHDDIECDDVENEIDFESGHHPSDKDSKGNKDGIDASDKANRVVSQKKMPRYDD